MTFGKRDFILNFKAKTIRSPHYNDYDYSQCYCMKYSFWGFDSEGVSHRRN